MKNLKNNPVLFLMAGFILTVSTAMAQAGALDPSFGIGGKVITKINNVDLSSNAIILQQDNKIVVGGAGMDYNMNADFLLVRYKSNGNLDSTFGNNGMVKTNVGYTNTGYVNVIQSLALQTDGKIIAGGLTMGTGGREFCIVRYNTDGTVDHTFGTNGTIIESFSLNSEQTAIRILIQPDGKILVTGRSTDGITKLVAIRYHANGTPDTTFGNNSKAFIAIGNYYSNVFIGSLLQPDGKILLVASSSYSLNLNPHTILVRFTSTGNIDNSFGTNGIVTTVFGAGFDYGTSLAVQPDGKILMAGSASVGPSTNAIAIARYIPNGTLDNTFGTNGKVTTSIPVSESANATSITLQPDGKILIGGNFYFSGGFEFALLRYDTNGALDPTFNTTGHVSTPIQFNAASSAMALQPDGKVVLTGGSMNNTNCITLARYLTDLNVGIADFSLNVNTTLIYPNPVNSQAILKYTLVKDETISVHLYDLNGKFIKSFITGEYQTEGTHAQTLSLNDIAAGNYILKLQNDAQNIHVKIIKH